MMKFVSAAALAITVFSMPALALSDAECAANWSKMDSKNAGYVMSSDNQAYVDAMKAGNMTTAAADRMSAKEYADACRANLFDKMK